MTEEARDDYAQYGLVRRTFMRHPYAFSFILGAVLLTVMRPCLRRVPDAPPQGRTLAAFALVDQSGSARTLADLKGVIWIAAFLATRSPDAPKIVSALRSLDKRCDKEGVELHFVVFSVDPTHDTPARLKTYAMKEGLTGDHWHLLTSPDLATMQEIVVKNFRAPFGNTPHPAGGTPTFNHSNNLWLVDDTGALRSHPAAGRAFFKTGHENLDDIFEWAGLVIRDFKKKSRGKDQ